MSRLQCKASFAKSGSRLFTFKAPLRPPPYLDATGKPHLGGIKLEKPPVCQRCESSHDSVPRLEQHAAVMNMPVNCAKTPNSDRLITSYVSLYHPLQPEFSSIKAKTSPLTRVMPQWMTLLPSNRNAHLPPPTHSALHPRTSYPFFDSTRYSSPFSTPPEWPRTQSQEDSPVIKANRPASVKEKHAVHYSTLLSGKWPSSSLLLANHNDEIAPSHSIPVGQVAPPDTLDLSLSNEVKILATSPERTTINRALDRPSVDHVPPAYTESTLTCPDKTRRDVATGDAAQRLMEPIKSQESMTINASIVRAQPAAESSTRARHKPALFQELSGFFASRKHKLILPSRALDRHRSSLRRLRHQRGRSNSEPCLRSMNAEKQATGVIDSQVRFSTGERGGTNKATLSSLTVAEFEFLCAACKTCPCQTKAVGITKKPVLRNILRPFVR